MVVIGGKEVKVKEENGTGMTWLEKGRICGAT
jgi:hypothetical protein